MADEGQVIRGIDWRSTFPFTLIFRSFRIAIHPSKLFLALVALLLIYVGGRMLDGVWLAWPEYRALNNEMLIYERSREGTNSTESFLTQRRMQRERIEEHYRQKLADIGKKDDGDLDDIEWQIEQQARADANKINERYNERISAAKNDEGRETLERERDRDLRLVYADASNRWQGYDEYAGHGLFHTFFNYEVGQLHAVVHGVRNGRFFGEDAVSVALTRFFMWGPLWAIGQHPVFFTLFGLYFLAIWSIFGGAIARIAAVHVARDEKISIRQALAFSLNKFLSFISAPIIPLLIVLIVGLVVAIGGALGNIPGIGPVLVGALYFLALLAGFIMTLILLGLVGGLNLMYPTIAVEGSDSFDAISRSFSYLYARPWRLAFYTFVAIVYGSICYLFVRFFIYLMLWLTHMFTSLFFRYSAENSAPLFSVMWPDPYSNGRLVYDIDHIVLTPMQSFGAMLLSFWVYLVISMLGAFAISFYFSAHTIIYYLMRNEVDATELDDVYLEQSDEEFTDTVATETTTATTTTVTTSEPTSTSASEEESSTKPPPDEAPQ